MPTWYLAGNERFRGAVLAGTAAGLLLDTLSVSATVAYSTRKLRSAYVGHALLAVTSAVGHGTQNIDFTAGNDLDTTSLLSFIGAGHDGGISTWYDQSGNGIDGTVGAIAGNSAQDAPIVVNNHALNTQNGHCAPLFTGSTVVGNDAFFSFSQLGFQSTALTQPFTVAAAFQQINNTGQMDITTSVTGNTVIAGMTTTAYDIAAPNATTGGTADTNAHAGIWIFNNAGANIYIDGTDQISGAAGCGTNGLWSPSNVAAIFNAPGNASQMRICEILVFASALGSADRALIRTSWQSYWGTP